MAFLYGKWSGLKTTPCSPCYFRQKWESHSLFPLPWIEMWGSCYSTPSPNHIPPNPSHHLPYLFQKRLGLYCFHVSFRGRHLIIHSGLGILIRTSNESSTCQFRTLMAITYIVVPATSAIVTKTQVPGKPILQHTPMYTFTLICKCSKGHTSTNEKRLPNSNAFTVQ